MYAQSTIVPVPNTRNYTGTTLQYSATGQTISGICAIQVDTHGRIEVQTSLNGVTQTYLGHLDPYPERTGTGYVYAVDEQFQPLSGSFNIPVFVTKPFCSGGALGENGMGLVFRALRSDVLPLLN